MNNRNVASILNNNCHGDDQYVIKNIFDRLSLDVVLDGISGKNGKFVSNFVADIIKSREITNSSTLNKVLRSINNTLFISGAKQFLTTVTAVLKVEGRIYVSSAGDSPAYIIRGNIIMELNELDKGFFKYRYFYSDEKFNSLTELEQSYFSPNTVSNALGLYEKPHLHSSSYHIHSGDKLVLVTDGVSDNLSLDEIKLAARPHRTALDSCISIEKALQDKKSKNLGNIYGHFKNDDYTILVRYF